jgi:hypothetical protein
MKKIKEMIQKKKRTIVLMGFLSWCASILTIISFLNKVNAFAFVLMVLLSFMFGWLAGLEAAKRNAEL